MNFKKKIALGSVLCMAVGSAFANTADLRVIGTFVPGACAPVFASGGVVDYGNIPAASLSPTTDTQLAARTIAYTITCDSPIEIATTLLDARANSASVVAATNYGLGQKGTVNTGFYTVAQLPGTATGDGAAVDLITRDGTTGAWTAVTDGLQAANGTRHQSYAAAGAVVPNAYTTFGGTLQVRATIARADSLDLTTELELNGLATLEVRYL